MKINKTTSGFTIIELLIAMSIALLLSVLLSKILISTTRIASDSSRQSYSQKSARSALGFLSKEIMDAEIITKPSQSSQISDILFVKGLKKKDKKMIPDVTNKIYTPENDLSIPWVEGKPILVYVNGINKKSGFTLDYVNNRVTFTDALTDVVTADFSYDLDIEYKLDNGNLVKLSGNDSNDNLTIDTGEITKTQTIASNLTNASQNPVVPVFTWISNNNYKIELIYSDYSVSTVINISSGVLINNLSAELEDIGGSPNLNSLAFNSENDGWVVGANGTILKHSINWSLVDLGLTDSNLNDITLMDSSNGYIGGSNGLVLKLNSQASGWENQNSGLEFDVSAVYARDYNDMFVLGGSGIEAKSNSFDGSVWKNNSPNADNAKPFSRVTKNYTSDVVDTYALGDNKEVYILNKGLSWTDSAPQMADYSATSFTIFNDSLIAGTWKNWDDYQILSYDSINWSNFTEPFSTYKGVSSIAEINGNLYAGFYADNRLFKFNEGTSFWDQVATWASGAEISDITSFNNKIYGVNRNGAVVEFDPVGSTSLWTPQPCCSNIFKSLEVYNNKLYSFDEVGGHVYVNSGGPNNNTGWSVDSNLSYSMPGTYKGKLLGVYKNKLYASGYSWDLDENGTFMYDEINHKWSTKVCDEVANSMSVYQNIAYFGMNTTPAQIHSYYGRDCFLEHTFGNADFVNDMIVYKDKIYVGAGEESFTSGGQINPIYIGTAGDTQWNKIYESTDGNINGISIPITTDSINYNLWAVGDGGKILKYQKATNEWLNVSQPEINTKLNSVFFYDDKNGWAVGDNGVVVKYDAELDQWFKIPSATSEKLNDIYLYSKDEGYIIGDNKTLLKIENVVGDN